MENKNDISNKYYYEEISQLGSFLANYKCINK